MIKILIVDDVKILRECLMMIINQFPDYDVIGCASNGREAIEFSAKREPDIILMDLNMPVCSGHEAIIEIKKTNQDIKILVLSDEGDELNISRAFRNGANGYVLKDISPRELNVVLKKAFLGEKYIQDNAFSIGQSIVKKNLDSRKIDLYIQIQFTDREKEVLTLVMEGMTNEEIGNYLSISAGRARNIVAELISKCMVKNRTQLAVIATTLDI